MKMSFYLIKIVSAILFLTIFICFDRIVVVSSFKVHNHRNNNNRHLHQDRAPPQPPHHHQFLEDTLQQTLAALATKLGEPFDGIAASFNRHMQQQQQKNEDPIQEDSKLPLSSSNNINNTSISSTTETIIGSEIASQSFVKNEVDHLKGIIKCSLPHEPTSRSLSGGGVDAVLSDEGILKIGWSLPSEDCYEFNTGVWLSISERTATAAAVVGIKKPIERHFEDQKTTLLNRHISEDCLIRNNNETLVSGSSLLLVHSNVTTASTVVVEDKCRVVIMPENGQLTECKVYEVQVTPEYDDSVRGQMQSVDIIIPPKLADVSSDGFLPSSESFNISAIFGSLHVSFQVHSTSCARQMTSLFVRIYPDGIDTALPLSMQIPRSCFKANENSTVFFMTLDVNSVSSCPAIADWKPLSPCRQYKVILEVEYSSKWKSTPFVWDKFITSNSQDGTLTNFWQQVNFKGAEIWPTTRQCINLRGDWTNIPHSWYCDGEYDCGDGSDEFNCNYKTHEENCVALEPITGKFSHLPYVREKRFYKAAFFIATKPGHVIWLNFKLLEDQSATVQVYDGAYPSDNNLIMNRTKIFIENHRTIESIRSSSNNMYVVYSSSNPAYQFAHMTIEDSFSSVYSKGCGGYLIDEGIVNSPPPKSNLIEAGKLSSCEWFIEASDENAIILMSRPSNVNLTSSYSVKMYDGWDRSAKIISTPSFNESFLGDGNGGNRFNLKNQRTIYSAKNKIRVVIESYYSPQQTELWNVTKISTPQYHAKMTGATGVIKTQDYPVFHYPNLADCRWLISTDTASKIRIFFASFQSEDNSDFVYVYDGATVDSRLLLQVSGLNVAVPFTVNSTGNEVLVRFTSDHSNNFSGFLAVYSLF